MTKAADAWRLLEGEVMLKDTGIIKGVGKRIGSVTKRIDGKWYGYTLSGYEAAASKETKREAAALVYERYTAGY